MDAFHDFANESLSQLHDMSGPGVASRARDCLENIRNAASVVGFQALAMEVSKRLQPLAAGSPPDFPALIRSLRRELRWAAEAWAAVRPAHERAEVDGAAIGERAKAEPVFRSRRVALVRRRRASPAAAARR